MNQNNQTYKPTAVGILPSEWIVRSFGEVIIIEGGSQPPLNNFIYEEKEGYIRLIQTRDYRTDKYKTYIPLELARKTCNKDDIIIGRYGPPIFQIFRGLEGAYNVALMKAIPNEEIVDKDYAYYYISRIELRKYLEGLSQRSGGQTGVEIDKLNKYTFLIPPRVEQKKIAEILSTWDSAIHKTKEIINQLKIRNKSLAFNLLIGVKRLKEFEGIQNEKTLIKDIAKEISVKNKSDANHVVFSCTKHNGLVPSLQYFGKQIYSEDLTTYKVITRNQFAYATNHIEEGSIGVLKDAEVGLISPMYTIFEFNSNVDLDYIFKLLKTNFYIYEYKRRMEGSIDRRGGLRWSEFSKIHVHLPAYNEQKEIAKILNTANSELELYQQKLNRLQTQKKGLMQQLLTGQIRTI